MRYDLSDAFSYSAPLCFIYWMRNIKILQNFIIFYITSDILWSRTKDIFLWIESKEDSYIKSRFSPLRLLFNGCHCNWRFFYFSPICNNVRAFSFSIIVMKRIAQKHPKKKSSCWWLLPRDRELTAQFFRRFNNIRTCTSDGRIQFHRDVHFHILSELRYSRVSPSLPRVYVEMCCNLQQPSTQKIWWHAIGLIKERNLIRGFEIKLTS